MNNLSSVLRLSPTFDLIHVNPHDFLTGPSKLEREVLKLKLNLTSPLCSPLYRLLKREGLRILYKIKSVQSGLAQVLLLLCSVWKAHTFSTPSVHTPSCVRWWAIVSLQVCNKKHEVILASSQAYSFFFLVTSPCIYLSSSPCFVSAFIFSIFKKGSEEVLKM